MIYQNYNPDFFTQQYVEELIRNVLPNAKIKNIIPFQVFQNNTNSLIADNTLFFGYIHGETYGTTNSKPQIIDPLGKSAYINNFYDPNTSTYHFHSSFPFLFKSFEVDNDSALLFIGWKITLDYSTSNANDYTPPITAVAGSILESHIYQDNTTDNTNNLASCFAFVYATSSHVRWFFNGTNAQYAVTSGIAQWSTFQNLSIVGLLQVVTSDGTNNGSSQINTYPSLRQRPYSISNINLGAKTFDVTIHQDCYLDIRFEEKNGGAGGTSLAAETIQNNGTLYLAGSTHTFTYTLPLTTGDYYAIKIKPTIKTNTIYSNVPCPFYFYDNLLV